MNNGQCKAIVMALLDIGDQLKREDHGYDALAMSAWRIMQAANVQPDEPELELEPPGEVEHLIPSAPTYCEALFRTRGHTGECRQAFDEYLDTLADVPGEERKPGDLANPCKGLCRQKEADELWTAVVELTAKQLYPAPPEEAVRTLEDAVQDQANEEVGKAVPDWPGR